MNAERQRIAAKLTSNGVFKVPQGRVVLDDNRIAIFIPRRSAWLWFDDGIEKGWFRLTLRRRLGLIPLLAKYRLFLGLLRFMASWFFGIFIPSPLVDLSTIPQPPTTTD